ncbi:HAD family hydrolase [Noviherbaspirillum cavernae]|uniref:HAD family hydrolase n=1 Tax=Noviherbaspirillum cavernae TaxID=2320862 RepID=A0A418WY84_9BURK|nr:HAD family hydrolase [Noviherbaspirillum cavernae]RJG05176.1 HAD family hydrolase [Noviherbaspirillum cavernae]
MHRIKAVFFDLDDTLWPIVPVIERAEVVMFDWLTQHAPGVADRFTIDSLRERRRVLLQENPQFHLDLRLLRHAGLTEAFLHVDEDVAKVDRAMAIFSEARNAVTLFDDVLPMLDGLRGRVMFGSISNGVADLEVIGLAHYFQASVAACNVGIAKPAPEIFHAACDALNILPCEAVHVGDDPVLDVEGAQKAGLQAVWMNRYALRPVRELPDNIQPDVVCTSFHELDEWLRKRII